MMINANVHSFESLAAVDGEGIRFDIFFTGCPLRCAYCHNPDTWHKGEYDISVKDAFDKIKRYKPYFKKSGGVTFSGGEPLLNADFINELYPMLKEENIGYCLDTSGSVPLTDSVKTAIDNADMIILDIKFHNKEDYQRYTKGDFERFVELGRYASEKGKRMWLRTVVVPGINDTKNDMDKYAEFVKQFKFEKYELLGFHTMGFFKYEKLNLENPLANTPALDSERLKELQEYLNKKLVK